ncbi:MAG: Asp-tRNA(Asn)/Glu-tRNA(Gln) amidotransferase subunit GatC [Candidatus Anstonellales archaeon]
MTGLIKDNKKLNFEISKVMEIARLKLTDEEKNLIEKQLLQIFDHFSEIQKLDLPVFSDEEKNSLDISFSNFDYSSLDYRNDAVKESSNAEKIINNFTNRSERYLKVPKSVE